MDAMATQKSDYLKSSPASSVNTNPMVKLSKLVKRKLLITSIVTFVIGTAVALYQPVHEDPLYQKSGFDLFFYPQENNPELKLPKINADINDITIVGADIWLVGSGGLILHSPDAGRCWIPQGEWMLGDTTPKKGSKGVSLDETRTDGTKIEGSETANDKSSAICPESRNGVDRVIDGIADISEDLDSISFFPSVHAETLKDKKQQLPVGSSKYNDINRELTSGEKIARDRYLSSQVSEQSQVKEKISDAIPPNYVPNFNKVVFINKTIGIIVGNAGIILRTDDAGKSWQHVGSFGEQDIHSVIHADGRVIAAGAGGIILVSRDLGKSWIKTNEVGKNILDIAMWSSNEILLVGEQNVALVSDSGGFINGSMGHIQGDFNSITINDNQQSLIAGLAGTIYKSKGSLQSFEKVTNKNREDILSIALNNIGYALAATGQGTIYQSKNYGETWKVVLQDRSKIFSSVLIDDGGISYVVGVEGVVKYSEDFGEHWVDITNPNKLNLDSNISYSVSLANWWYLLSLICGVFVLAIVWPKSESDHNEEGIAGIAASDKPLQPGDPDAANLAEIAADITSFLSNPKTTAPLTLAITGPWGSGKSSLMNLVRAGLIERQFSPVWFNAWHHQKGEQLLASLFAHIKEQAIPSWLSIDGIWFRMKLATIRARRHWVVVALMFFLLFMAWSINQQSIADFTRLFAIALSDPSEFWKVPWEKLLPIGLFSDGKDAAISLASLLGVTAPLIALMKGIRGFGVSPEKLVSVDHRDKGQKGYDPGARARFASEFKDVTQALGNNKMVIFIDDLDRCSQDNLIDILENINFISTSGDCYLILGMAPKYIKACVANAYETLAKSIAEKEDYEKENNNSGEPGATEKHKFNFANQYLEKMINIEVAVPCMKDKGIAQLLIQQQQDKAATEKETIAIKGIFQLSFDWLTRKSGLAIKSIILISAIGYGWQYGEQVPAKPKPEKPAFYELGSLDKSSVLKLFAGESYSLNSSEISEKIDQMAKDGSQKFSLFLQLNPQQKQQEIKVASLGDGGENVNLILRLSTDQLSSLREPTQKSVEKKSLDSTKETQQKMTSPKPRYNDQPDTLQKAQKSIKTTKYSATFRQAESEKEGRLSASRLFWGLVIFVLIAMYIKKREKEKFSSDSDDFVKSIVSWTPWIQIKQSTPRAIKRFLNHLRFQSIRNRKLLKESLLVAASAIYFYDSKWILNEEKFRKLCNDGLYDLLVDKYEGEKLTEIERNHIRTVYEQLVKSLSSVDMKLLFKNREQAIQILTGAR